MFPLFVNILVAFYIYRRGTENVSMRALCIMIALVIASLAIYAPSLLHLSGAQKDLADAVPGFIEENFSYGGWYLTEGWLTVAIFDGVYTLSGTELPALRGFRKILHIIVGVGFLLLLYSYFAPFINKLLATNQTQPANQTRTT
jgi:hypothetical protein